MLKIRPSDERGHAKHGWLDSHHTFSFANYYDPAFVGFRSLLVINEDRVQPAQGFGKHGHEDMEILSYVIDGALEHKDSMGTGSVLKPGDVQVMSAGTGVRHSEYNLEDATTKIFQIWIEPNRQGGAPAWGAKPFPKHERAGQFVTLASGFAEDIGALPIRSDARVLGATLNQGETAEYALGENRLAYLVPAKGSVEVNGVVLNARDGAAIAKEAVLRIKALDNAEIVMVDAAG